MRILRRATSAPDLLADVWRNLEQASKLSSAVPTRRASGQPTMPSWFAVPVTAISAKRIKDGCLGTCRRARIVIETGFPQAARADGPSRQPTSLDVSRFVSIIREAARRAQKASIVQNVELTGINHC